MSVNGKLAEIILKSIAPTPLWIGEICAKDIGVPCDSLRQVLDRMARHELIFPPASTREIDTNTFADWHFSVDTKITIMMTDAGKDYLDKKE